MERISSSAQSNVSDAKLIPGPWAYKKEGRKDGRDEGREGRTEGTKGRQEGRKDGRD